MCLRIAEVHQQAIAEILGNMALEALDDRSTGLLVRPHNLPQVLRIKAAGEGSRVYQVAEQYRELTAFGHRGLGRSRWAIRVGDVHRQGNSWGYKLGHGRSRKQRCFSVTGPNQDSAVLIEGQAFGVAEFVLQIIQVGVVQAKSPLESPVRNALLTLQDLNDLGQDLFKGHCHPSATRFLGDDSHLPPSAAAPQLWLD